MNKISVSNAVNYYFLEYFSIKLTVKFKSVKSKSFLVERINLIFELLSILMLLEIARPNLHLNLKLIPSLSSKFKLKRLYIITLHQ